MSGFKVIIIGGGPVGLAAAHAFSGAGIDFVLLERRPNVVEDAGASLVLSPQTLRVLGQLGLLEAMREIGQEVLHLAAYTTDGNKFREGWHTSILKDNNGAYPTVFHRAEVVRVLYEGLIPKYESKILTNKKVMSIEHTKTGVRVSCEDGSVHEGSMVLGADGVHSKTRYLMHELKAEETGSKIDIDGETPFYAEYKTIFCSFPRLWEYAPGDFLVTHGHSSSLQLVNGHSRSWIFIYEHIGKPTHRSTRVTYTEKDIQEFAAKHADLPVGDKLKFKDVWGRRHSAGMTNLEEGVLPSWAWGRIALAGDAAHKFTPNAGMGFNSGLQDVVALANSLHQCVQDAQCDGTPDMEELSQAFDRYQSARIPAIKNDLSASAAVTRMCAWPNRLFWVLDQYVLNAVPWLEGLWFNYVMSTEVSRGLVLYFLKGREPFVGKKPWANPIEVV